MSFEPDPIALVDDGYVDMPNDETNPCLNCGACCSHFRVAFYHGELNYHPAGFVPDEMAEKVNGDYACMSGTKYGGGRCIALRGTIGKSISCSIYENRPTPCRKYRVWLEDGSPNPDCQKLRAQIGLKLLEPIIVTK
jgi:Fe-S-cluster containining protein